MNPMVLASLNDQAALLVGQLIMSWGLFDQRLYSQIIFFECRKYIRRPTGDPPAREDIADYRFEVRLKRLRKLSHELCYGDPKIMSRVDDVIRRLKQLSLIRHHLAHGYSRVLSLPGAQLRVEIKEHREQWKKEDVVAKIVLEQRYRPTIKDLDTSYTFEELAEAKRKTDRLYEEFSEVCTSVAKRGP
jgi:hypothetical protein